MSWADVNLNEDPSAALSQRIVDLEDSITAQFEQLRQEMGMAVVAARRETANPTFLGDLEQQLANAVSSALSSALEAIRQSLTEVVTNAINDLDQRMYGGSEVEVIAATLQHQVLLALSTFEQSLVPATVSNDPLDQPATARDIARLSARVDELRAQLFG